MHLPSLKEMKDAVWEDDAPKAAQTPTPQAPPPAAAPVAPTTTSAVEASSDAGVAEMHDRLVAKSDYTASAVFRTLQTYLDPLKDMPLDDKTKFGMAMKLAAAKDGITADAITAAFQRAKQGLQLQADTFAKNMQQRLATDVEAPKQKADALAQQVRDLQAEIARLAEQSFAAQQRLDAAKHKFDTAAAARLGEIEQEEQKYARLLA